MKLVVEEGCISLWTRKSAISDSRLSNLVLIQAVWHGFSTFFPHFLKSIAGSRAVLLERIETHEKGESKEPEQKKGKSADMNSVTIYNATDIPVKGWDAMPFFATAPMKATFSRCSTNGPSILPKT